MKKYIIITFLIVVFAKLNAQSYIGFLSDNYNGVHGAISNPASIADSPFKTDVNIAGVSAFANNNYFGVNVFDALKNDYSFDLEAKKNLESENNASGNFDVLGPSFMLNLSETNSIALFTRARSFININNIDGATLESIDDDSTNDFTIQNDGTNGLGHAWAELGVAYAHVLLDNDEHFLKGGVTLKYLKGLGSAYIASDNLTLTYDDDGTDLGGGQTTGSIASQGNLNYGRSATFDEDDYEFTAPKKASGFATDIGFVYEWRPNYEHFSNEEGGKNNYTFNEAAKYKLKIGLSITDIGQINYKEGLKEAYNITNPSVSEDDFDNADSFGDFLNSFYTQTNAGTGYKIDLPTAVHFNVDWNINGRVFLNLNTDVSVMSKDRITANRITNLVSLTPRYEKKWFSVYMPVSVVEYSGLRLGAGLRAGPLYLGSGSLISAITGNNNKQADVYAGLKVPMFKRKDRDKDGDGIIDRLDDCPRKFGPIENNGCPWGDKDSDEVLDNIDNCPEESGPKENNGCPWGDKDGDGVTDNEDACPEVFGLKENKGCPSNDSDGDGVLDKDDVCVNTPGTVANNGCPEQIIKEMQKTLNDYAKVIHFNSGTYTIKDDSHQVLLDIIEILKEYPNARFTVEGHTDSIGSYENNQVLSERRANAVKAYLVESGIDATRLSAIGYGEKKPIATNMYKAGREKNRRVEINLVKLK